MCRENNWQRTFWSNFPDDLIDSEQPCLKQMMEIYSSTNSSVVAIESVNKKMLINME